MEPPPASQATNSPREANAPGGVARIARAFATDLAPFLLLLGLAAAPRLVDLDNRLMHRDEAVHAVKFGALLEQGEYTYDPAEYHGPTLNYLTLPVAAARGKDRLAAIGETDLRLVPALAGILLVGLVWLARQDLGRPAALLAGVLAAVSPGLVFYSRYYVQEMLLVCFTFGAMLAVWRLTREDADKPGWLGHIAALPQRLGIWGSAALCPSHPTRLCILQRVVRTVAWLLVLGTCVGLAHATKETCVIPLAAMAVAALLTLRGAWRQGIARSAAALVVVMIVAASVSAMFYSSFGANPHGVVDSYAAYFEYLARAGGQGDAGPHVHPWNYYLRILFYWRQGDGPVWSEGPVAVLALLGAAAAIAGRGIDRRHLGAARFLVVYSLLALLAYSALPYKTPWCAMGVLHGLILLAGLGAAAMVRLTPTRIGKGLAIVVLLAGMGQLAWETHRTSFVACDDPDNPYVYAHTDREVLRLVQRVEQLAAFHADRQAMHLQVICPDDDYWPLPWYLRDFERVGWFAEQPLGPSGPPAPVIVIQPEMRSELIDYLMVQQPPGQRALYASFIEPPHEAQWNLRQNVPLEIYVQNKFWREYQTRERE